MHVPINWKPCRDFQTSTSQTRLLGDLGECDPCRDLLEHFPSPKEQPKDYWAEMVEPLELSSTSDDLVKQFLEQLAEREHIEPSQPSSSNEPTQSRSTLEAIHKPQSSSPNPQEQPCVLQKTIETSPMIKKSNKDTTKPVSLGKSREKTKLREDESTRSDAIVNVVKTAPSVQSTIERASPQNSKTCTSRLWRPSAEFYASRHSKDKSTTIEETQIVPEATKTESHSSESSFETEISCESRFLKDTEEWKIFKQQHYKAQRQRLTQRHGIYDPLLFTSSESMSTSESEFF